jgi:hypothetical protein
MFPRKEQGIPVNGIGNYVMDDVETMTFFAIPGIGKTVLLHLIGRKAQSLVDEDSKQPYLRVLGLGLSVLSNAYLLSPKRNIAVNCYYSWEREIWRKFVTGWGALSSHEYTVVGSGRGSGLRLH